MSCLLSTVSCQLKQRGALVQPLTGPSLRLAAVHLLITWASALTPSKLLGTSSVRSYWKGKIANRLLTKDMLARQECSLRHPKRAFSLSAAPPPRVHPTLQLGREADTSTPASVKRRLRGGSLLECRFQSLTDRLIKR